MKMYRTVQSMTFLPLFRYAPQREKGQIKPFKTGDLQLRKNDDFKLLFTGPKKHYLLAAM